MIVCDCCAAPITDEGEIRFRCARCGGDFVVPEHPGSQRPDERRIVRIGGETWCEPCARKRHHRGFAPDGLLGERIVRDARKGRTGDMGEG